MRKQQKAEFDGMWKTWASDLAKDNVIRDVSIKQDMIDVLTGSSEAGLVDFCIVRVKNTYGQLRDGGQRFQKCGTGLCQYSNWMQRSRRFYI